MRIKTLGLIILAGIMLASCGPAKRPIVVNPNAQLNPGQLRTHGGSHHWTPPYGRFCGLCPEGSK